MLLPVLTFGKHINRLCPLQGIKQLARKQARLTILSASTVPCVNVLLDWSDRRFCLPRNQRIILALFGFLCITKINPCFFSTTKFLFESLEDLDRNLKARGSKLYLFEGNSLNVIQELTCQLLRLYDRPELFFNHDVQVQYGIERNCQIINIYRQHSLDYHQGLNLDIPQLTFA